MKKANGLKGVVLTFFIALVVLGFALRFSGNGKNTGDEETTVRITAIDEALQRNMTTNYPQTPKEVIKYFGQITQCYYNENFSSDEELIKLADRMLLLYDDELVSYKNHEDYINDLKSDISFYKDNGFKLTSYAPSASTDVEFFTQDGYEWARIWCLFSIRSSKGQYQNVNEVFILRKDDLSHWRIYGWKEADEG